MLARHVGLQVQQKADDACWQPRHSLQHSLGYCRRSPIARGLFGSGKSASSPSSQDGKSNTTFRQQLAALYAELSKGLVLQPAAPPSYQLHDTSKALAAIHQLLQPKYSLSSDRLELLQEFVVRQWVGLIIAQAPQQAAGPQQQGMLDLQLGLLHLVAWIINSLDLKRQGFRTAAELKKAAIVSLLQSTCSRATAWNAQEDLAFLRDGSNACGSQQYEQYMAQQKMVPAAPNLQPLIDIACACAASDAAHVDEALSLLGLCVQLQTSCPELRTAAASVDTSPMWQKLFTPPLLVDVQILPAAAAAGIDLQAAVGKKSFSLPPRGMFSHSSGRKVVGQWWDGSMSYGLNEIIPRLDVWNALRQLMQLADQQQQQEGAVHITTALPDGLMAVMDTATSMRNTAADPSGQVHDQLLVAHIEQRMVQLLQQQHVSLTAAVLQVMTPPHPASYTLWQMLMNSSRGQEGPILGALLQHTLPCALEACSKAVQNDAATQLANGVVGLWLQLPAEVHQTSCLAALCNLVQAERALQGAQQARGMRLSLLFHSICQASSLQHDNTNVLPTNLVQAVWAAVSWPLPEVTSHAGQGCCWVAAAAPEGQQPWLQPSRTSVSYRGMAQKLLRQLVQLGMGPQLMRVLLPALQRAQKAGTASGAEYEWLVTLLCTVNAPIDSGNTDTLVLQYQGGFELEDAVLLEAAAMQATRSTSMSVADGPEADLMGQLWLSAVQLAPYDDVFLSALAGTHQGLLHRLVEQLPAGLSGALPMRQVVAALMKLAPCAPTEAEEVNTALIDSLSAVLAAQLSFPDVVNWVTQLLNCEYRQSIHSATSTPAAAGMQPTGLLHKYLQQLTTASELHPVSAGMHLSALNDVLSHRTPSTAYAAQRLRDTQLSAVTSLIGSDERGLSQQAAVLARCLINPQPEAKAATAAGAGPVAAERLQTASGTGAAVPSSSSRVTTAPAPQSRLLPASQQQPASVAMAAYGTATAADFEHASQRVLALQGHLLGQMPPPSRSSAHRNKTSPQVHMSGQLVLTATTRHNIEQVEQILLAHEDAAPPLLLEGATGIGKTATVQHVVDQHGLQLIRFNMSASITVEDLCGRVMLSSKQGSPGFEMQLGPFCKAFKEGLPLLVDELNLARDEVLRCIETALDSGVMQLHSATCADQSSITIERAAGFRLLATQNPSAGAYRGLRERLSPALLARFTILSLQELPASEWKQVVSVKLEQQGVPVQQSTELAEQMVEVHLAVDKATTASDFPEVGKSYSQLTIRELLRWTDVMATQLSSAQLPPETSAAMDPVLLGRFAISMYMARYRSQGARSRIMQAITTSLHLPPAALMSHLEASVTWSLTVPEGTTATEGNAGAIDTDEINTNAAHTGSKLLEDASDGGDCMPATAKHSTDAGDSLSTEAPSPEQSSDSGNVMSGTAVSAEHISDVEGSMSDTSVLADSCSSSTSSAVYVSLGVGMCEVQRPLPGFDDLRQHFKDRGLEDEMITAAIATHLRAVSILHSPEFIKQHGVYQCDHTMLEDWLENVASEEPRPSIAQASLYGYWAYGSMLRHQAAREELLSAFDTSKEWAQEAKSQRLLQQLHAQVVLTSVPPPLALTKHMLEVLQHATPALQSGTPLLVTGSAGCGKAAALEACATLLQLPTTRYQLTADSEPSDLVGEYAPTPPGADEDGERIAWVDGVATRAVKQGGALVLSHLETAEAKVIERLNPLLEQPASWTLTERGDTAQCAAAAGPAAALQVMATLTPPTRHGSQAVAVQGSELSPALANRFSCVHMRDVLAASDEEFKSEMQQLAATLLSDSPGVDPALAADVCLAIRNTLAGIKAGTVPLTAQGYSTGTAVSSTHTTADSMLLTLRTLTRLLNACYHLSLQPYASNFSFQECLAAAFQYTILPQLGVAGPRVASQVHTLLGLKQPVTVQHGLLQKQKLGSHILTDSRASIATALKTCLDCNLPVLLEGPAAVGKTSLVEALAGAMNVPLLRVNNSMGTTAADYFGTYVPDGQGGFTWQPGPLLVAVRDGCWLLVDELNLAPPPVLSLLGPLLDGATSIPIPGQGEQVAVVHGGFRLVATCNPAGYSGRHALPLSLRSRFQVISVDDFPVHELPDILQQRFKGSQFELKPADAKQLATLYDACRQPHAAAPGAGLALTLRDLIKAVRRAGIFSCPLQDAMLSLLAVRHPPGSAAADSLLQAVRKAWPLATWLNASTYKVQQSMGGVLVSAGKVQYLLSTADLSRSPLWKVDPDGKMGATPPTSFMKDFVHMVLSLAAAEPVLLEGPACYKTLLAQTYCQLVGCEEQLMTVHLNEGSDVADLLGQLRPYTFEDLLQLLPSLVQNCLDRWEQLLQGTAADQQDPQSTMLQVSHTKLQAELSMLQQHVQSYLQEIQLHKQRQQAETRQAQEARSIMRRASRATIVAAAQGAVPGSDGVPLSSTGAGQVQGGQGSAGFMSHALSSDSLDAWLDADASVQEESIWDETTRATGTDAAYDRAYNEVWALSSKVVMTQESLPAANAAHGSSHAADQQADWLQQAQQDLPVPSELSRCMAAVLKELHHWQPAAGDATSGDVSSGERTSTDATMACLLDRVQRAWQYITADGAQHAGPLFAFKDGPVVTAARQGLPLLLENFSDPPPAVTERLNSLLDTEPTLNVVEDPMAASKAQGVGLAAFSIIATAHAATTHRSAKQQISPAARSRFTVLSVAGYNEGQLRAVVQQVIGGGGKHAPKTAAQLTGRLWLLREAVQSDSRWRLHTDVELRRLLVTAQYLGTNALPPASHVPSHSVEHLVLLAASYLYMDHLQQVEKEAVLAEWWTKFRPDSAQQDGVVTVPGHLMTCVSPPPAPHANSMAPFYLHQPEGQQEQQLVLAYNGARINLAADVTRIWADADMYQQLTLTPTPSLLSNMARIFIACSVRAPLLLQGPPGIGKTAAVMQVATLTGHECVRINLCASTSIAQLCGTQVPRFVDGMRVFEWQDGSLVSAVRRGAWVLLDELNLAPHDVQQAIAPLLDRSCAQFTVPGSEEVLDTSHCHIFATMNPQAVGGGRTQLPRSILNKCIQVVLDTQTDQEVQMIMQDMCRPCVRQGLLTTQHVDMLLSTHHALKHAAQQGGLSTGAASGFNLRDLEKVRKMVSALMSDQLQHYQLEAALGGGVGTETAAASVSSADGLEGMRLRLLSSVLELVYGSRFAHASDRQQVKAIIDQQLAKQGLVTSSASSEPGLDVSLPDVIRLGYIFMPTGTHEASSSARHKTVLTRITQQRLQQLAAAVQSKCTVLLDGPTGSGKTSLVQELASRCRRQLVVLPLNSETDASDFIGQWVPARPGGAGMVQLLQLSSQ